MKLAKETDAVVSISEYQKYWLGRFLLHIASGLSWSGPTVWLKTNLCWSHLEMPGAPSLVRTCKCSFFLWNVTSGYTFSTARLDDSPSACVLQKKVSNLVVSFVGIASTTVSHEHSRICKSLKETGMWSSVGLGAQSSGDACSLKVIIATNLSSFFFRDLLYSGLALRSLPRRLS